MNCGCHSHGGFLRSPEGLAQRNYSVREGVDRAAELARLGTRVSVSGLRRDEIEMIFDEEVLDEQHRRFLKSCKEVS